MSFVPLSKPSHRGGGSPMITIGHAQQNRQTYLSLNSAARRALGEPAALALAWDAENFLLLVTAASPDDVDAYRITKSTGRISVTRIMRDLGLTPQAATTMPARRHGSTGLVIDVSEIRTRSVTPLRRVS